MNRMCRQNRNVVCMWRNNQLPNVFRNLGFDSLHFISIEKGEYTNVLTRYP